MTASRETFTPRMIYSDDLSRRHPYNPETSFETQRGRDRGLPTRSADPSNSLVDAMDPSMEPRARAAALKLLVAHCARPETKVMMIRRGIVPAMASLLLGGVAAEVEYQACLTLRTLCCIPQGCVYALLEGGIAAAVFAAKKSDASDDRANVRRAAVDVVAVFLSSVGRELLFGTDDPPSTPYRLEGYEPMTSMTLAQIDELAKSVVGTLVECATAYEDDHTMLERSMVAMTQASMSTHGLHLLLLAGIMRCCHRILSVWAENDAWLHTQNEERIATCGHVATILWHAALDPVGQVEVGEFTLLRRLADTLRMVLAHHPASFGPLKAALSGALSALALQIDKKKAMLEPLSNGGPNAGDIVLQLLRQANGTWVEIRSQAGESSPFLSIIKNCVQAMRLFAELPQARVHLQEVLREDTILKRQIFYSTPWQNDFGVQVY